MTILAGVPRTVTGERVHIIPEQIQAFPDCVRAVSSRVRRVVGSAGLDVTVQNGLFAVVHDFADLGSSDADVEAWLDGQRVYSGVQSQQGRVLVDRDFDRAVTVADYEVIACDTPGVTVSRASAVGTGRNDAEPCREPRCGGEQTQRPASSGTIGTAGKQLEK